MKNVFMSNGKPYLEDLVKNSTSFSQILEYFFYSKSGASIKLLKNILDKNQIDYSHFNKINVKANHDFSSKPLEYYLSRNVSSDIKYIKQRLIKENTIDYKCSLCNCKPFWLGQELVLHLDHINGDNSDNRLENLRFLCPNCHSQTWSYSGKAKKNRCIDCHKIISHKSKRCQKCSIDQNRTKQNKIFNIDIEQLKIDIWQMPMTEIANKYGCSDKLISKRCKEYNIEKPPRGYFLNK